MSRDHPPAPPSGDAEFEQWLTNHPQAESELADLQNLRELYQAATPPEPEGNSWQATQSRIHETLAAEAKRRRRAPRPVWLLFGATAAAAILVFILARSLWISREAPQAIGPARSASGDVGSRSEPTALADEALPVAEEDDIAIVSMDARDVSFLVVGEPPISGALQFARPQDIRVIKCERCPYSGHKAKLQREGEVPMFVSSGATELPIDDW
jgi:hypothetical protein